MTNGRLEFTRQWLARARISSGWKLYVSALVLREVAAGDPDAARERLKLLEGLATLKTPDVATGIVEGLLASHALPRRAEDDALHIALAAVHGLQYLVTWNCTHIANAATRFLIEEACGRAGYAAPTICTPEELNPDASA